MKKINILSFRLPAAFKVALFSTIFFLVLCAPLEIQAQLVPEPQSESEEPSQPEWPTDELGRRSPRGTVSGFLSAVASKDYDEASAYFNLVQADIDEEGGDLARIFENFLNQRGQIIPKSWLSADPGGRKDDDLPPNLDRVGTLTISGENIDLYVEETKGPDGGPIWLFSSATIEKIDSLSHIEESELLVDRVLPPILEENEWNGVPVGQWLIVVFLIVFAYVLAWSIIRLVRMLIPLIWRKAGTELTAGIIKAFALPVRLYLAVWLFIAMTREIGLSIILRQQFSGITIIIGWIAFLLLLWQLAVYIGRFSKHRMTLRGNVSGVSIILFLQRAAKVAIIIFGIIAILGVFGVDVTTGLAALGIGGLALALGAQKTIENFVGSVTVITDQPVRVGDFCKVGDIVGTVEKIGMRSTRIRTLDRTVVTIPNGKFSSENIENYAHRDRFWFHPIFGLRYETTPEQIRYLLVELRTVLFAHPLVSNDPARVRFVELGSDSINLEVFSYITVKTYDEYLEVKEDLLLLMMDVIAESGTGFAFPSQTIYFGRDSGLSKEKSRHAEEKVKEWRTKGELQLPQFDPEKVKEIENKTPYPPVGSSKRKDDGSERFPGM